MCQKNGWEKCSDTTRRRRRRSQVVEEVGSSTVDQSICLMADIKMAQFALLKSSLSNILAGFNFGECKGG